MSIFTFIKYLIGCTLTIVGLTTLYGQYEQHDKLIDLKGDWKFSVISSDNWKKTTFDDSAWETIKAPSPWENQGYHGFNGFGFYRKTVFIPAEYEKYDLFLHLGYIDDADVTYLNGVKIGMSGSFPPRYVGAYNTFRKYHVPAGVIKSGQKNTIAIQVYDVAVDGGIVGGTLGFYGEKNPLESIADLSGEWKFNNTDSPEFKQPGFNDDYWNSITVPGTWEEQGYPNYDGFAWYRKKVFIPKKMEGKMLVLLLGKIDDCDQTFINGKKIGQVGEFSSSKAKEWSTYDDWKESRAYFVSPSDFKAGRENTIAIRVYDVRGAGGIYKGPLFIVEKDKYVSYWRSKKH